VREAAKRRCFQSLRERELRGSLSVQELAELAGMVRELHTDEGA
jgi:hypothetical protein